MFVTNQDELKKYRTEYRLWQGIPSIAVTPGGRIFVTFYSGALTEQIGNYVVLIRSDDDGKTFSEPIAAAFEEAHRCFDPCLWIDPIGRLWFTWAHMPENAVYAVICDHPDADRLVWSKERVIGNEVMMNKPTVLATGEWLFPIAVWKFGVTAGWNFGVTSETKDPDRGAFVYKTIDNGRSFEKLGKACVDKRSFDEHMILERRDGVLAMYVRTTYGIGVSYSYDKGKTWSEGVNSGIPGPCSRFFIRRLKSGRVLAISHYGFRERDHLTAFLSEDDGKTWPYRLLLDERNAVSYPDAMEDESGYIHIVYDRERGAVTSMPDASLEKTYAFAREILTAKITEADILAGKIVDGGSYLKRIASKLGKYALEAENPYHEIPRYSNLELARLLFERSADEIITYLFNAFGIDCANMHKIDYEKLDALFEQLKNDTSDRINTLMQIITLIRSVTATFQTQQVPIVERVKKMIAENVAEPYSAEEIADALGISKYYMCHLFKQATGITVKNYEKEVRLSKAKELLLNTTQSITEIAGACGYESVSYFSKLFIASEKISPSSYRRLLKNSGEHDKNVIFDSMLDSVRLIGNLETESLPKMEGVKNYIVTMPAAARRFLHEAAVVKYHGILFAAWYNNEKNELYGETPIRCARSFDDGKTWTEPETVADDKTGKILFCPPVFGIENDRLYLFLNQMTSPDHIHALDLYRYEADGAGSGGFTRLWSRPIPFKLNTNVYTLPNGKRIIAGRIGKLDQFPDAPAVLISDDGSIEGNWRPVTMQPDAALADGSYIVHAETSLVFCDKLYAFCRNDQRAVPLLYVSEDFGETWSAPITHDIPFSGSKIYSGTLQDGRNYVVGNLLPDRRKLAIFFSRPHTMQFDRGYVVQDGYSEEFGFGCAWHYPCAFEQDGKLYLIYTATINEKNERGAVLSVIDLASV